ncbi:WXG100 family type VII secretion target [Dactylosporangium sp. NPDC050688]|uniref:WXG100 family type VII secretion target n=1 Tax=Dactylosporangium sp. NPDC050688 TaxID=3157217 RepID=UPI0033F58D89
MDALERLASIGADLLHRVDGVLVAGGAPAGDPLWPLLRQVGALPGDALDFGLKLSPPALREAAARLRADAERFARRRERLAADLGAAAGGWEGSGAEAFAARWQSLAGHIGDGSDPVTIAGRLRATAAYADAVAGWAEGLRHELAEAVARVATSVEAVTIRGTRPDAPPPAAVLEAAARIGARVLQPVADAFDAARDLERRWSPELAELRYTEPTSTQSATTLPITRVTL